MPQTSYVKGIVMDSRKVPIEYANVVLYDAADSTEIVKAVTIDGKGRFELLKISHGNYRLQASCVGYVAARVRIDNLAENIQDLQLVMQEQAVTLDETTVMAQRVVMKFDRQIIYPGKFEKKFLYKLYQIADVGVHPSLNEQCSYVAIEMMMHGIPLVGIDSAGIGGMIESGYNGYKVCTEQGSLSAISKQNLQIEQLGKRISEILKNDELRQRLSENSRIVLDSIPINSFSDIQQLVPFKDKFLFIDIWASWCTPCRAEFSYNKQLNALLEQYPNVSKFIYFSG